MTRRDDFAAFDQFLLSMRWMKYILQAQTLDVDMYKVRFSVGRVSEAFVFKIIQIISIIILSRQVAVNNPILIQKYRQFLTLLNA